MSERLAQILSAAGAGWLLETDRAERLDGIGRDVALAEAEIAKAVGHDVDLLAEIRRDLTTMKPLVQSFAAPMTGPMRAMIYTLVTGGEIVELAFQYVRRHSVTLHVVVALTDGKQVSFDSTDLWDAEILRHLGLMKAGDRPIIDGYYAFGSSS